MSKFIDVTTPAEVGNRTVKAPITVNTDYIIMIMPHEESDNGACCLITLVDGGSMSTIETIDKIKALIGS